MLRNSTRSRNNSRNNSSRRSPSNNTRPASRRKRKGKSGSILSALILEVIAIAGMIAIFFLVNEDPRTREQPAAATSSYELAATPMTNEVLDLAATYTTQPVQAERPMYVAQQPYAQSSHGQPTYAQNSYAQPTYVQPVYAQSSNSSQHFIDQHQTDRFANQSFAGGR